MSDEQSVQQSTIKRHELNLFHSIKTSLQSVPLRIALYYLVAGLLWIWLSDRAILWAGIQGAMGFWAAAGKGTLFVILSSILIFWATHREFRRVIVANDLLRVVSEGSTDAIFVKDSAGKYLLFNEAAAKFVGKPISEVIGRDDSTLFDPESAQLVMQRDQKVITSGIAETEIEELTVGGAARTFLAMKAPYRNALGEVVGVIGISRDISDRKRSEQQLRIERDRFEKLVEAVPNTILSFHQRKDGTSHIPYASPRVEHLYGFTPAELAHDATPLFSRIHADDIAAVIARIQESERDLTVWRSEFRVHHPTRGIVWVEGQSAPIRLPDGSTIWHGSASDVTERKMIAEQLNENVEMFRSTFEQAAVGIAHVAPDGRFIRVNGRLSEITQYTREELLKRSFQDITPTDDLKTAWSYVEYLLSGELSHYTREKKYIRKDGSEVWVNLTDSLRRNDDGSPLYFISVIEDVTERKQADLELQASRTKLKAALNNMMDAVFISDANGNYLEYNDAFATFYKFKTRDECCETLTTNPSILEVKFPNGEICPIEQYTVPRALTGEIGNNVEYLLRRTDTNESWIGSYNFAPFRDENGTILGTVVVARDITLQKQADDTLRKSEERFRTMADAAPVMIWVSDIQQQRSWMNRRWLEFVGRQPAEEMGNGWLENIHPEDRDNHLECLSTAFNAQKPFTNEYRLRRHDGEYRWILDTGVPQFDSHGKLLSFIGSCKDFTDRRNAERTLRESEERLQLALAAGRLGIWEWDIESDAVFWSPEAHEIMGIEKGKFSNTKDEFARMIHPDDADGVWKNVADVLQEGKASFEHEFRVIQANGSIRWLMNQASTVRNSAGKIIKLIGVVADITNRRESELAIRESEARFRTLIEFLPDAIFLNVDGKVAFCNRSCITLLGANQASDLLGKSVFDLRPPEYHHLIQQRIVSLLIDKKTVPGVEEEIIRLNGVRVPVFVNTLPVLDRGRDAILVVLHDLTDQKRIEEQLRQQEFLIREASELAHVGGWWFDPKTLKAGWTEEIAHIHDLGPNDELGVENGMRYFVSEDRPRIEAAVKAAIEHGTPYDLELRIITAKGVNKWVRTIARPILDQGVVVRVRGSMQDITERKMLEEQFQQSQKMEAVGRLAGGIAHDFNNLLTVINGYCDLTLMTMPANDSYRPGIAAVRDAGERATSLTSQLLAFSRKAIIAPKILDVKEVIGQSEKLLRRLIGEDIILNVISHPADCYIKADPSQVDQVVMNLAVNARDAMPTGGRLTLEIKTVDVPYSKNNHAGRYVELSVSDTGCGMTEEVRSKIFEPFFTTKGLGKGTGLGLAVVHGIIQQAGGQIRVESTVGVGTTFHLLFPEVPAAQIAEDFAPMPAVKRGTETILLVEDDDAVRNLCRIGLESQGYTVLLASSGQEAIRTISQNGAKIHLLVTDVVMPEMSGRELADAVREIIPSIRILFVSGYTDDAVFRHGVRESIDAFLQKPFTPLGLARKVRSILDGD